MYRDVVTFLYHEVSNNPNSTGFLRKSNIPYKHKEEDFVKNIEVIKDTQIIPSTIKVLVLLSINGSIAKILPTNFSFLLLGIIASNL